MVSQRFFALLLAGNKLGLYKTRMSSSFKGSVLVIAGIV